MAQSPGLRHLRPKQGPCVSTVVVDWSANESIRKLLAAEILSQRRVVHSLRKPSEGHNAYKSLLAVALVNRTPAFLGPVNHLRKTGALLLCRTACAWHGFLACTSVHSSWARKRRLRVSKNSVCTTVRKKKPFWGRSCVPTRVPYSSPTGRVLLL